MPIRLFVAECELRGPLYLPPRTGSSLATTIRGAYGAALVDGGGDWLQRPHSTTQRRDHATPIIVRVTAEANAPEGSIVAFELSLVLLGRRAIAEQSLVLGALFEAGQRGLTARKIGFGVEIFPLYDGTLASWCAKLAPEGEPLTQINLALETPMDADVGDFPRLVGTVAHDLVQWDLEDSGLAASVHETGVDAKRWCDTHADAARRAAEASLAEADIAMTVADKNLGKRRSHTNLGKFPLGGYVGLIDLRGNLNHALPWLRVLELVGGGRKKSFGLGTVRLLY